MTADVSDQAELFRHVSVEKTALYRAVMDCFAAAKRQFRLHLRPDEVLAEGRWDALPAVPRLEEVQAALVQLTEWGNLESQPDTTRVASIADFYRAKFLYRLSLGGEAVEAALATFARTLARRAELQTVALEDIAHLLESLLGLAAEDSPDAAKVHAALRDLVRVFEGPADNARAFMAGIARGRASTGTHAVGRRRPQLPGRTGAARNGAGPGDGIARAGVAGRRLRSPAAPLRPAHGLRRPTSAHLGVLRVPPLRACTVPRGLAAAHPRSRIGSVPGPWRGHRVVRQQVQLSFDFDDELPLC